MADLIDRALQRKILEVLSTQYPHAWCVDPRETFPDSNAYSVNIHYLAEHGLLTSSGLPVQRLEPKITAKGIDFLADDGGLGAILEVVTVKLHSETIRDLLISRVQESDEPDTVKSRLIDQLKATPAQALGQLTERALDAGLQAMPRFAEWLQGQI